MKKLLFGASALLLLAACNGKSTNDESAYMGDTVTSVEEVDTAVDTAVEPARLDSVQQDSIKSQQIAQSKADELEQRKADELEQSKADKQAIKQMVKKFYEGAVIGSKGGISWTKSSLSKYCTQSFIKKLENSYGYDGPKGLAVWILRNPYITDSDGRDKVISVDVDNNNTAIVTYLDCGYTSKTRLNLVKEGDQWKINNCKFISGSSKSKYPEYNW